MLPDTWAVCDGLPGAALCTDSLVRMVSLAWGRTPAQRGPSLLKVTKCLLGFSLQAQTLSHCYPKAEKVSPFGFLLKLPKRMDLFVTYSEGGTVHRIF